MALKDFMRCFLTQEQKILLASQRSKVATKDNSDSDFKRNNEMYAGIGKCKKKSFVEKIASFVPQNDFESKLVQGVLYKNNDIPKQRHRHTGIEL